ncbi:MAG: hypothetical protein AB8B91_01250 [Rubripirellula sp.]
MSLQKKQTSPLHDAATRCFGIRIENHVLQMAIATPMPDGRYSLEIDEVNCESTHGWLNASGTSLIAEALKTLADRHEIRRGRVAISLDGDFCVSRVATGSSEEIDKELSMLAVRVPRYLQLGPGEKVTGYCRTRIAPGVEYAVTGVVNRTLIQVVYDASRIADIDVTWVEPALVSVARMIGQGEGSDQPVMIADGTGKQWDVGIASSGRLLLDYRPASATNEEALREALDGHISRLKRFCTRHRGVSTGELSRMMICGSGMKTERAMSVLGDSLGVTPEILKVPELPHLYEFDSSVQDSRCVPAVATVLPLLIDVPASDVPDLLHKVRRERDLPLVTRFMQTFWPAVAATLMLVISYGLVSGQRERLADTVDGRADLESQIDASAVKFAEITHKRELITHLKQIESATKQPDFDSLLGRITQSLPDTTKLNEYRLEPNGHILLDGTVLEESMVYELVNNFRHLPGINEVALTGTAPDEGTQGTRFAVRLTTTHTNTSSGSSDE